MGRQHTMYLSDATWRMMQLLKEEDESMSAVIRKSIELANNQHIQYDAISELEKKKDVLRDLMTQKFNMIELLQDIADLTLNTKKGNHTERMKLLIALLEKEGYIE